MRAQGNRRHFLRAAGRAAVTLSLGAGALRGAGHRVNVALVGAGRMGSRHLATCAMVPGFQITHVCDVSRLALARAEAQLRRLGRTGVTTSSDYREVLADPNVDAVCIATPDRCHAPIAIAACAAGKDVYVETPACVSMVEGAAMVEAARRYRRVVQSGAAQRSGRLFQQVREAVSSGQLGEVAFCRIARLESLDLVHFAFEEAEPLSVSVQRGSNSRLATFRYPRLVVSCDGGIGQSGEASFHGSRATLRVDRDGCRVFRPDGAPPPSPEASEAGEDVTVLHWRNWLDCIRTRTNPVAEIETCVRVTHASLLALA